MDLPSATIAPEDTTIRAERPEDREALAALHRKVFGPGRFARASYRIRERGPEDHRLNLVAEASGAIVGAVHFTPLKIGSRTGALLLGPLAVLPQYSGKKTGRSLVEGGAAEAKAQGYDLIILVGDLPYFERVGFAPVPRGQLVMPGPVNPARFLYRELVPGALAHYHGPVETA